MTAWHITNILYPHRCAARLRRHGYEVASRREELWVAGDHRPWGELAGFMTPATEIREVPIHDLPEGMRRRMPFLYWS